MADILKESSPTFVDVDVLYNTYGALLCVYSITLRDYILDNDKSCYFIPRKVRQSPLLAIDVMIAILYKCVQYKDGSDQKCATI